MDLPPQCRRGAFHARADGVAPVGEGSHCHLPQHPDRGPGPEPFDRKGGLGRFYEVFGEQYEAILTEMNRELVA